MVKSRDVPKLFIGKDGMPGSQKTWWWNQLGKLPECEKNPWFHSGSLHVLDISGNHEKPHKKYGVFWWFCLEWPSGQKKTTALLPATLSFEILVCHPSKSSFFYAYNWGCHSAGVPFAEVPQDGDLQALRLSGAWSRLTSEGLGGCQHPNLAHWCHHQARRNVIWKFGFDFVFYRFFLKIYMWWVWFRFFFLEFFLEDTLW